MSGPEDAWAAMDAWCVRQGERVAAKMEPHVMAGGSLDDRQFRRWLGESNALLRMRSFIHGSRNAPTPSPPNPRMNQHPRPKADSP